MKARLKNSHSGDLLLELRFEVVGAPMGKPEPIIGARQWGSTRRARRNPRADPWLSAVRRAARDAADRAAPGRPLRDPVWLPVVPLELDVTYWLLRPARHVGTGRNSGVVKAGAPRLPCAKPDLSNLTKGLEDALADWPRGAPPLLFAGDQQVVVHRARKRFADERPALGPGGAGLPGATVVIRVVGGAE